MSAQVILAFANDPANSLSYLQRENEMVYGYLNRMDKNIVNAVQKPAATIEQLFEEFNSRKNDIAIFHFSGHAGEMQLMFNDNAANGGGIAQLMAYAPNIELVFLNGCATADLIDAFHQSGVKRVIATSRKVFDNVAAEFAIKFYSSLSQLNNIKDAFIYAQSFIAANNVEDPMLNSRHISTSVLREENKDDFPYAIYYKADLINGSINKNLSDYEKYDEWSFDVKTNMEPVSYDPCLELLKCIGEKGRALVDFLNETKADKEKQESKESPGDKKVDEEKKGFIELYKEYKDFGDKSQDIIQADKLSEKVIGLLPRPLGIIMRQMVSTAKTIQKSHLNPSMELLKSYAELLKYQLHFYDVMVKISCFTMLSDLYEVIQKRKEQGKDLLFDRETHEGIIELLSMDKKNVIDFNYRELIRNIQQKIIDNEGKPFVAEYCSARVSISDNDLEIAHDIIKQKRQQNRPERLGAGLISHCKAVEDELCNIFQEVYFIMRYNLLVVRNVEAIRTRFITKRTFQHRVTLLNMQSIMESEYEVVDDCTENYSVILVKGLSSIIDFLSLSPFVIDRCVLTDDGSSQLFYYSHCSNGVLVYEGVDNANDRIEIEICEKEIEELSDTGELVISKVKYIPYVEDLVKYDKKLSRKQLMTRLMRINEQFKTFKNEMGNITFKIKK